MVNKVTQQAFVEWFEKLYTGGAIYLWGANGETITKTLCDKLFSWYGSATYNKAYYDSKLTEGKGKIGADCSGAMYKLSGVDRTAKGYYNACVSKGLIAALPKDKVCLVFNKSLTHVGAYLGNGVTVEMKNSKANVHKENLKPTRWYYYGIPDFVDYTVSLEILKGEISSSDKIISDYQAWLNDNLSGSDIAVDGKYGSKTKTQTVKMIQTIYNKYWGTKLDVDGDYGPKTKAACPGYNKMKKNTEAFKMITYIIHVYLYAKCGYAMNGIINSSKVSTTYSEDTKKYVSEYQNSTRGLVIDGYAGTATLYQMFK